MSNAEIQEIAHEKIVPENCSFSELRMTFSSNYTNNGNEISLNNPTVSFCLNTIGEEGNKIDTKKDNKKGSSEIIIPPNELRFGGISPVFKKDTLPNLDNKNQIKRVDIEEKKDLCLEKCVLEEIEKKSGILHYPSTPAFRHTKSEEELKHFSNLLKEEILSAQKNHKNIDFHITSPTNSKITFREFTSQKKKENKRITEIRITGYIVKNLVIPHIEYVISVINHHLPKTNLFHRLKVFRRFADFVKLREILVKKYIGMFIPSLPEKQFFGHKNKDIIEYRKKFLQIFCHELQISEFFNDCKEIKLFFDPKCEDFHSAEEVGSSQLSIIDLLRNNKINFEIFIDTKLDFLRSRLESNTNLMEEIFLDNKILHLYKTPNIAKSKNKENIFKTLKTYILPKKLRSMIEEISKFRCLLIKNKKILNDISYIIKKLKQKQKEYLMSEHNFFDNLIDFQNNFILPLNPEISNIRLFQDSLLSDMELDFKNSLANLTKVKIQDKFYKIFEDFIGKECLNVNSELECINAIYPFIYKLIDVDKQLSVILKPSPSDYINLDMKSSIENKKEVLKEAIIILAIHIHRVEMKQYKMFRLEYFYNALSFMIECQSSITEHNNIFQDCFSGILTAIATYMKNKEFHFAERV
jgi:hypothetical protein